MSLRLLLLPDLDDAPVRCIVRDDTGMVHPATPTPDAPLAPVPGMRDVLAVPATAVRIAYLSLQAHSTSQARAAARRSFEADAALDGVGAPHVAVAGPLADGAWLAVAVAPGRMEAWLARADALGLAPSCALVPDALLLPRPDGDGWSLAVHDRRWLARGPASAFSSEPGLAEWIVGGAPRQWIDDGATLATALLEGARSPPIDLRQGDFAPAVSRRSHLGSRRRLAIAATMLLASLLLLPAAGAVRDELAARDLQQRAADRVARVLPAADANALQAETSKALAVLRAGDRFAADAGGLFAAVAGAPGTALHAFDWTGGGWRVEVDHPQPAPPAALLEALADAGMPGEVRDTRPAGAAFRSTIVAAGSREQAP